MEETTIKPETPEGKELQEFDELVRDAHSTAMTLFSFVGTNEFTLHDVREHTHKAYAEAKKLVIWLWQYGYVTEREVLKPKKRSYFRVTMDREKRKANLEIVRKDAPQFSDGINRLLSRMP